MATTTNLSISLPPFKHLKTPSGSSVTVNLSLIRSMTPTAVQGTMITFSNGDTLQVQDPIKSILTY